MNGGRAHKCFMSNDQLESRTILGTPQISKNDSWKLRREAFPCSSRRFWVHAKVSSLIRSEWNQSDGCRRCWESQCWGTLSYALKFFGTGWHNSKLALITSAAVINMRRLLHKTLGALGEHWANCAGTAAPPTADNYKLHSLRLSFSHSFPQWVFTVLPSIWLWQKKSCNKLRAFSAQNAT